MKDYIITLLLSITSIFTLTYDQVNHIVQIAIGFLTIVWLIIKIINALKNKNV